VSQQLTNRKGTGAPAQFKMNAGRAPLLVLEALLSGDSSHTKRANEVVPGQVSRNREEKGKLPWEVGVWPYPEAEKGKKRKKVAERPNMAEDVLTGEKGLHSISATCRKGSKSLGKARRTKTRREREGEKN